MKSSGIPQRKNNDNTFKIRINPQSILAIYNAAAKDYAVEVPEGDFMKIYNDFEVRKATLGVPPDARWHYCMTNVKPSSVKFIKMCFWKGMSWYAYLNNSGERNRTALANYEEARPIAQDLGIGAPGKSDTSSVSPQTILTALSPLAAFVATQDKEFHAGKSNNVPYITAGGQEIPTFPGCLSIVFIDNKLENDMGFRIGLSLIMLKHTQAYIVGAQVASGAEKKTDDVTKKAIEKSLKTWHYSLNGYNHDSRKRCNNGAKMYLFLQSVGIDAAGNKEFVGEMPADVKTAVAGWVIDLGQTKVPKDLYEAVVAGSLKANAACDFATYDSKGIAYAKFNKVA